MDSATDHNQIARLDPESRQQVRAFIEDVLRRSGLPGISVALDVDGTTLEVAAGVSDSTTQQPMRPETRFPLGCINKLLTSLFVLDCAGTGAVDLDEAVATYLPEFVERGDCPIRVKHLLTHTAGYEGENWSDPDVVQEYEYDDFIRGIEHRRRLFEPGTRFDYSHSAAVLLGRIGEIGSGQPRSEWLRERIFRPLGIKAREGRAGAPFCARVHAFNPLSGGFEQPYVPEWGGFWSASLGGPWSTMRDLARIGRAIVTGGSVIAPSIRDRLVQPAVLLPGLVRGSKAEPPFHVFGHGCARYPNGSHGVRSTGPTGCSALRFDIERQIVIAVAVNAEAPQVRDLVIDKLYNALLPEDAPLLDALNPLPETGFTAAELAGSYFGANGHSFEVVPRGNGISLSKGHNPAMEVAGHPVAIPLEFDEHGGVRLPELAQGLALGFFRDKKTGRPHLMVGANLYARRE